MIEIGGYFSVQKNGEVILTKHNSIYESFWDQLYEKYISKTTNEYFFHGFSKLFAISDGSIKSKFVLVPDDEYNREIEELNNDEIPEETKFKASRLLKWKQPSNWPTGLEMEVNLPKNGIGLIKQVNVSQLNRTRFFGRNRESLIIREYRWFQTPPDIATPLIDSFGLNYFNGNDLLSKTSSQLIFLYHDVDIAELYGKKDTIDVSNPVKIPIKGISNVIAQNIRNTETNAIEENFFKPILELGFDVTCRRVTLASILYDKGGNYTDGIFIVPISTVYFDEEINFKNVVTDDVIEETIPTYKLHATLNPAKLQFNTKLLDFENSTDNDIKYIEKTDNEIVVTGNYTPVYNPVYVWNDEKISFNSAPKEIKYSSEVLIYLYRLCINPDLITFNRETKTFKFNILNSGLNDDFTRIESNKEIIDSVPTNNTLFHIGYESLNPLNKNNRNEYTIKVENVDYEGGTRVRLSGAVFKPTTNMFSYTMFINAVVDYNDYLSIPSFEISLTNSVA